MTQEGQLTPPPVMWAQRRDIIFLTICLEDCKDPTIKVDADKLYFKGLGGTEKKTHEVTVNFYKEIDSEKVLKSLKGRYIEFVFPKKEVGPFWPRLTKENSKFHWLKSDFNKWQDEDDSDEEGNMDNNSLEEIMRQMGGLGGGGAGGKKPDLDDLDLETPEGQDSDDEDEALPDLE